jgi:hypothetical protein
VSKANESGAVSKANESGTVSDANESDTASDANESRPLLRVVKGDVTEEELAALVALVAARASAGTPVKPQPRSEWGHPARAVRGPHRPGPDAWRRSAWA